METVRIEAGKARIEVRIDGEGAHDVVLLPSLGRSSADFDALAAALARGGFRAVRPEPRGMGGSEGPLSNLTLHDLAADVIAVIEAVCHPPVTVLGHAFGNRVARVVASDRPDLVDRVILVAAGGKVPIGRDVMAAMNLSLDLKKPDAERLPALRLAFFAEGNDPSLWLGGWWPEIARAQFAASHATPVEDWWQAAGKRMLVLQADEDAVAPAGNAEDLQKRLGDKVTVVSIPRAGHALLAEQPQLVADAVIGYLAG